MSSVELPCQINVAPSDGHKFQKKTDFSFTFHNLKKNVTGDVETREIACNANTSANTAHQIPSLCLRAQTTDHQQHQALHVAPSRINSPVIAQQSHESGYAGASSPNKLSAAMRLHNSNGVTKRKETTKKISTSELLRALRTYNKTREAAERKTRDAACGQPERLT
jgi:hypothetical protein